MVYSRAIRFYDDSRPRGFLENEGRDGGGRLEREDGREGGREGERGGNEKNNDRRYSLSRQEESRVALPSRVTIDDASSSVLRMVGSGSPLSCRAGSRAPGASSLTFSSAKKKMKKKKIAIFFASPSLRVIIIIIYIYIYIYICIYVCVCVYIYIYIYVYTFTHRATET